MELSSQYDPREVEDKLYSFWEKHQVFSADPDSKKEKYCIILPPPNVTGVLHMGHALTVTLEDILIRRKRMQGFNTLWLPGTDHAGIATQMIVERHLQKEKKVSRHELGREKFLEQVWKWKDQSQETILSQMRLLGCSTDWSRLRFTLEEGVSKAVRECFVRLFNDNLIYRDECIISWCPRCRTALSDLEVKFTASQGHLWHIRYLVQGDEKSHITVATTRPETLLGDTAIAVHPEDDRFSSFHEKKVVVPLAKRVVPIILDTYVEKEFGTGALKITPAHDANDYLIGKKYSLPSVVIMDDSARMTREAGDYCGLTREEARKRVLVHLTEQGLLEKEIPYSHNVGSCDRCGTMVEPRLSRQWFVKAEVLAKPAIEAVKTGRIKIIPQEWEKTYFEWMHNIRPWCISRQLWWGHRIPVWYCSCGAVVSQVLTPKNCPECASTEIRQDEDVLDTWFSSGLWPFSTLGWPEKTKDLKAFFPTDVMETGFDILFFWVARMIMLSLRMTGQIPFHTVFLHPMVRDEFGQKMSKTKGNVKDPLDIVKRMGADSLRFTLAAMAVHGRDVLLSDNRIEGYRNFVNKLWNASRFILTHFSDVKKTQLDLKNETNRWIWARLNSAVRDVNQQLDNYRFFDAANRLYHFIWNDYCDWFIELIKVDDEMSSRKLMKESTAIEVLERSLRLLHPIMPFVTEEIWQKLPLKPDGISLSLAPYPLWEQEKEDNEVEKHFTRLTSLVEGIRSKRGENGLSPNAEIRLILVGSEKVLNELRSFVSKIRWLVKAKQVEFKSEFDSKEKVVAIPFEDIKAYIPREDLIQIDVEIERTQKEIVGCELELKNAKTKLNSDSFISKAPSDVVEGVRARKGLLESKLASLRQYLTELKS